MRHREELSAQFLITPARSWYYFLLLLHSLALSAIFMSNLMLILQLIIAFALGASLWVSCQKAMHAPPVLLKYHSASGWTIEENTQLQQIQIMPSTLITTALIIIHYRNPERPDLQAQICFRDSLSRTEYKKLIVLLKLNGLLHI